MEDLLAGHPGYFYLQFLKAATVCGVCVLTAAVCSAQTNPSLSSFKDYIRVGGQVVAVENHQCTYTLNQSAQGFPASGGASSLFVWTLPDCDWTASSGNSWITLSGSSMTTGPGFVTYSVASNIGSSSRSGTMTVSGQSFTITQAGTSGGGTYGTSSGLHFVWIPPCRLVDTRSGSGSFGAPSLAAGSTRSFPFLSGSCGIPATAQAYSFHITAIPATTLGYITVWPSGQTQPAVSTLNSYDGRVKADAVIVQAGSGGAVSVYTTSTTDIVMDVDGYFEPDTAQLSYFPVTPCRVATTTGSTPPSLTGGVIRNFTIASSACKVPAAAAYFLVFTAVPKNGLGYLTVWAAGQPLPNASILNDVATNPALADAAIVAGGPGGQISVFASNDTDLLIDVIGYFNPGSGGYAFYPTTPCRAFNSPAGAGPFSGTLAIPLGGTCGLPADAQAYVVNATAVPSTTLSYLNLWSGAVTQPNTSILNAQDGAIASDMDIVQANNGSISAYATNPTNLFLDVSGYFAP